MLPSDTDRAAYSGEVQELFDQLAAKDITVRGTYDVSGLRADADVMIWWHAETSDALQEAYNLFRRTRLGKSLDPVWSNMALHRPAEFNKSHVPAFLADETPRDYISVYPFVRSYDWYLLPDEDRRRMLADHGKMARGFPDVRANTVASFSLGDYEWVLAFEADELHRIVDLMRHLRASEARMHVREEVPFYTGSTQVGRRPGGRARVASGFRPPQPGRSDGGVTGTLCRPPFQRHRVRLPVRRASGAPHRCHSREDPCAATTAERGPQRRIGHRAHAPHRDRHQHIALRAARRRRARVEQPLAAWGGPGTVRMHFHPGDGQAAQGQHERQPEPDEHRHPRAARTLFPAGREQRGGAHRGHQQRRPAHRPHRGHDVRPRPALQRQPRGDEPFGEGAYGIGCGRRRSDRRYR